VILPLTSASGTWLVTNTSRRLPETSIMAHRGALQTVEVEGVGALKLFGLTAKLSKTPGAIDSPPPRLGAHTEEILTGLGYAKADVAAFREKGIV